MQGFNPHISKCRISVCFFGVSVKVLILIEEYRSAQEFYGFDGCSVNGSFRLLSQIIPLQCLNITCTIEIYVAIVTSLKDVIYLV